MYEIGDIIKFNWQGSVIKGKISIVSYNADLYFVDCIDANCHSCNGKGHFYNVKGADIVTLFEIGDDVRFIAVQNGASRTMEGRIIASSWSLVNGQSSVDFTIQVNDKGTIMVYRIPEYDILGMCNNGSGQDGDFSNIHMHDWKEYVGFTEVYKYCDCGEKQK